MKNKLEVGMYVRYTRGYAPPRIGKILERENDSDILRINNKTIIFENDVIKSSFNIIDLIKKGDYVNGIKVYQVGYNFQDDYVLKMSESNYKNFIYPNDIKTVVTKEQFESMEYRLGGYRE